MTKRQQQRDKMAGSSIPRIKGEEYPFGEKGYKSATFSELFDDSSVDEAALQRESAREAAAMRQLREAGAQSYPPPQDILDLHGCTAQEAEGKTLRFVGEARRRGILTVRVITGKGLHSPGGKAVLPDTIEQALGLLKKEGVIASFQWDKKVKSKSGSLLVYL